MAQKEGVCSIMGNKERNSYVKNQIIITTIKLFMLKDWETISISETITNAQVSRNSFYRNFNSKEDILKTYFKNNFESCLKDVFESPDLSFSDKLRLLFAHFEEYKELYNRLYTQNLLHIFKDILVDSMELTVNVSAIEAYTKSYVIYMIYGWIEVWLQRGMKESSDEIALLFSKVK